MKAPNKIYINKYMLKKGMMYPAQEPADEPEFEYIRKDALLEWAIVTKRNLENDTYITKEFRLGAIEELKLLISKINSL